MDLFRGCTVKLRIALDVLQIICFNFLHFGMYISGIYIKQSETGKTSYNQGEFMWLGLINILGFVAPFVLLLKVVGLKIPTQLLRVYYAIGCISLLLIPSIVTAITYFKQSKVDKNCTGDCATAINKTENHLGCEIVIFIISIVNSFLYAYSLVLTWFKIVEKANSTTLLANIDQEIDPPTVAAASVFKREDKRDVDINKNMHKQTSIILS